MSEKAQEFDYQTHNVEFWNDRAPIHAASPDYSVERFVSDPLFISDIVDFDRPMLGDISGLTCIHLQCHIGTDTLSLARLGAASVTGLDFSEASIAEARLLAERTRQHGGSKLQYLHADLYSALDMLQPESFDLVFTGVGALPWISSIARWAEVVSGLLRPGGQLFIREGHPVLEALDHKDGLGLSFQYPYFETKDPSICQNEGTYVEVPDGLVMKPHVTGQFGHGLGEIVQALIDHDMCITVLKEHDTVPWNALPGHMSKRGKGEWGFTQGSNTLPLSYTLKAVKSTRI